MLHGILFLTKNQETENSDEQDKLIEQKGPPTLPGWVTLQNSQLRKADCIPQLFYLGSQLAITFSINRHKTLSPDYSNHRLYHMYCKRCVGNPASFEEMYSKMLLYHCKWITE